MDEIQAVPDTTFIGDGVKPGSDRPEFGPYSLDMDLQVIALADVARSPDTPQKLFVRHHMWVSLNKKCLPGGTQNTR